MHLHAECDKNSPAALHLLIDGIVYMHIESIKMQLWAGSIDPLQVTWIAIPRCSSQEQIGLI